MCLCPEEWKVVPGRLLYRVSSKGRVVNQATQKERIWLPSFSRDRHTVYWRVILYGGRPKHFFIHRLVMLTFEPREDAHLLEVHHGPDTDPKNNCYFCNLKWVTKEEHRLLHGLESEEPDPTHAQQTYDKAPF